MTDTWKPLLTQKRHLHCPMCGRNWPITWQQVRPTHGKEHCPTTPTPREAIED